MAATESTAVERVGRAALAAAALALISVAAPVIWRGAPLADDFNNCLAPLEQGVGGFLAESWNRLGVIRSARFVEILLTTGVCRALPFGVAIAVPLAFTLAIALLVRGLLRDVGTPKPWPDVGGTLWLLQPLGTEAALWPAALHVPLGITFALVALRAHFRGRHGWAAAAAIGAAMSVEQTILSLPFAAHLLTPPPYRRRAVATSITVAAVMLVTFALSPGADPRLQAGAVERLAALFTERLFYVGFPAVGLGLHSMPLAIQWALPWSILVLGSGALIGVLAARQFPPGGGLSRHELVRGLIAVAILLALVNAPVLLTVPRQGSPRIFAPTYLVLIIATALVAPRVRWRQPLLVGGAAGLYVAGAILSLAFSVAVRLATADFNERAAHLIADRVRDGAQVAVCGVRRTVVEPAPRGSFSIHEWVYEWGARRAVVYYTGRWVTFHLAGELWDRRPCPDGASVDALISFDELLAAVRR